MLWYNKFGDIMNKKFEFQKIIRLLDNYESNKLKKPNYDFLNNKQINIDRKQIIFYFENNNIIKRIKNNKAYLQLSNDTKQYLYNQLAYLYGDEYIYINLKQDYFEPPYIWHLGKIQRDYLDNKNTILYLLNLLNKKLELNKEAYSINGIYKKESLESLKKTYADISIIYLALNDNENFEKYALLGAEIDSIRVLHLLINYYCEKDNSDLAKYYLDKCLKADVVYEDFVKESICTREQSKIFACNTMYQYYFNNGMYQNAKEVAQKAEVFIKKSRFLSKEELINIFAHKILECGELIEKSSINENTQDLETYFNHQTINMMNNDIKVFINTSLNIYNYIECSKFNMDYSAALIPCMKGVELLLYNITIKYLNFVKKHYKKSINFNFIHKNFKYKDNNNNWLMKENIDRIEYGQVLNSMAKKIEEDWVLNVYFKDFYTQNTENKNNIEEALLSFVKRLDDMTQRRNRVAHKGRIFKKDADECIKKLIFEHLGFISLIYENFEFVFNAQDN